MTNKKSSQKSELVFVPLGGVGEIGMNVYLYGLGAPNNRRWIMVDLGITFPGPQEPGVDAILPDLRFIEEERKDLEGIVLTHAHEDHYGAIIDLWPALKVPIYATAFTAGLLNAKLVERGLEGRIPVNVVRQGSRFNVGPFDIEFVDMAHSIPEPNGLAIRTEHGLVFHSGDWKLDPDPVVGTPTNENRLAELGEEGVHVLICDSTNALRDGISPSEGDVGETLKKIIGKAKTRVAVTTFASNVARILSIHRAAIAADRHVVLVGRAMKRVVHVAKETGQIPEDLPFLDEDDYGYLPREKVVLICTGSQGEARAALSRVAAGNHPNITLAKDDLVIFSSRTIPGNEKIVTAVQNNLAERGIHVLTDQDDAVHVSGHPRRGELEKIYKWLKPHYAIPMHGEPRHLLGHCQLAKQWGAQPVQNVRNGAMVRIGPGSAEIIDNVPTGRLHRDGKLFMADDNDALRDRRRLSFAGHIAVSLLLKRNGELADDPEVVLTGVPEFDDGGLDLTDRIVDEIIGVIESIPRPRRKDEALVAEAARRGARARMQAIWGKKPICRVMVHWIG